MNPSLGSDCGLRAQCWFCWCLLARCLHALPALRPSLSNDGHPTLSELKATLKREGYFGMENHLQGRSIRCQLRKLMAQSTENGGLDGPCFLGR